MASKNVTALLECAKDYDESVQSEIKSALVRIGHREPQRFLKQCKEYLDEYKRLDVKHRVVILGAMQTVISDKKGELKQDETLLRTLLSQSVSEMTESRDINTELQGAAAQLLVEITSLIPDAGAEELISRIPSFQLPHYFVMKGLADFAHASPKKFIPHLKSVMTRLLPMLSLVKQENMKWVFAASFGRFAEAVLQYNEGESDPNPMYATGEYSDSMSTALNMMHAEWLNGREVSVKGVVCEAMGYMCTCIHKDIMIGLFPKLITSILPLMKREKPKDLLPFVQGLYGLMETTAERVVGITKPNCEAIWQVIHSTYCSIQAMPLMQQLEHNKLTNELLRCAELIAKYNTDTVLGYIQKQFDAKFGSRDPTTRASTMAILRHVINRLEPELADYRDTVIATVILGIGDTDYRVRKAVIQCVIAMGPSPNGYLGRDGGQDLLGYVAKNASISPQTIADWDAKMARDTSAASSVSPREIKNMCSNLLSLFVSSLPILDQVLWPYILECMGHKDSDMVELFHGFPTICSCIASLCDRLKDTDYFGVDYDSDVNLPGPAEMVAKFMVHVACTVGSGIDKETVIPIVKAMLGVAPLMTHSANDTTVPDLWAGTIPQLLDYINSDAFEQTKWEDVNHKLLSNTITSKKDERWTEKVGTAFLKQMTAYNQPDRLDHKRISLSMTGMVISKSGRREFVNNSIDQLMENTDHKNLEERQGCAKGLAYIAATNLDSVLDRLSNLIRPPKASGGFFAKKDPTEVVYPEMAKATALLAYGHLSQRTSHQILTSRLETQIVPNICQLMGEARTQEIKEAGLQCVEMMAKGSRKAAGYIFRSKEDVMSAVINVMNISDKRGNNNREWFTLCTGGLRALTSMMSLEPKIGQEMQDKLLKLGGLLFAKEWEMPYKPKSRDKALEKKLEKEWHSDREAQAATLKNNLSNGLNVDPVDLPDDADELLLQQELALMLCSILEDFPSQDRLACILEYISASLQTGKKLVRKRAMTTYGALIKRFADLKPASETLPHERQIDQLGVIISNIVPRFCDTDSSVRRLGIAALHCILELQNNYHADGQSHNVRGMLEKLMSLRSTLGAVDARELFLLVKQISSFLAAVVSLTHVTRIIDGLLDAGVLDVVDDASNGACVILNGLMNKTGKGLSEMDVTRYAEKMIAVMPKIEGKENSMLGMLHCWKSLSKHHVKLVVESLLTTERPYSPHVVKAFHTIVGEPALTATAIHHLLDLLMTPSLFEETSRTDEVAICVKPLGACVFVGLLIELFESSETIQATMAELRAEFTCILLLYLCAAHTACKNWKETKENKNIPNAVKCVMTTLEKLIPSLYGKHANEWMKQENLWDKLGQESAYASAIAATVKCLISEDGLDPEDREIDPEDEVPPLTDEVALCQCTPLATDFYTFTLPFANKTIECQRVGATAILGQILFHCGGESEIVQGSMNCLLSRSGADEKEHIKTLAVDSLKHITVHPYDDIGSFLAPIITTLLAAFNDESMDVALKAMTTLLEILRDVNPGEHLATVVVPICMRLKSTFEHQKEHLRAEAFRIFTVLGDLTRAGKIDAQSMETQMFANLPVIIVHCNDSEQMVRQPAKQALHSCAAWFVKGNKKSALKTLFQKPTYQPDKKMDYEEFAREFAAIWVREYLPRCNDTLLAMTKLFDCPRDAIKCNAAIFSGYVLSYLDDDGQKRVNVDQVTTGLAGLLKADKSVDVRIKAARALGFFKG